MTGIGPAPSRPVGAEDIRDLQSRACHPRRRVTPAAASDAPAVTRPRVGGAAGDLGVARGGVELGMPEQHLDHPDVDLLLEEIGGTVHQAHHEGSA